MADEEIIEEVTEENSAVEPLIIETKGKWQPFENMTQETFVVGKTYHIELGGICEVAVSVERPTNGIITTSIDYTKDDINKLWIKTGGI